MYKYLIVTHIPAFYKINLYKELSKRFNIFVIFISNSTSEVRSDDFISKNNLGFKFVIINSGSFQKRKVLVSLFKMSRVINSIEYEKLIVNGWDLFEFWYLLLTNIKEKNCLALESSINESNTNLLRKIIKKIFLYRVSLVFAAGTQHSALLNKLDFKGQVKITFGVGIINKPQLINLNRSYNKNFLYVGRLTKVKNLELLIRIFNKLDGYRLTIIGEGEDKKLLKDIAKKNIVFEGAIQNKFLHKYYLSNDVLILPSLKETWGLVVEEALFFGMPVIVSKNCGSSELIKNNVNGFLIDPGNIQNIRSNIKKINNQKYSSLLNGVMRLSIDQKDKKQVSVYL
jgi:glycosyltransferase involved in cell wall biosynthesis